MLKGYPATHWVAERIKMPAMKIGRKCDHTPKPAIIRSNYRPLTSRLPPKPERQRQRLPLPPSRLVAPPVKLTVVHSTERHGELVADPTTEGAGSSEAQMVRVARDTHTRQGWFATNFRFSGGCLSSEPAPLGIQKAGLSTTRRRALVGQQVHHRWRE